MLEQESKFYKDHESELLEQYKGRWILLVKDGVYGDYDNLSQAYHTGVKELGLGNFMIQQVEEQENLVQRFYSRVYV